MIVAHAPFRYIPMAFMVEHKAIPGRNHIFPFTAIFFQGVFFAEI
jgi:hypothetical protein